MSLFERGSNDVRVSLYDPHINDFSWGVGGALAVDWQEDVRDVKPCYPLLMTNGDVVYPICRENAVEITRLDSIGKRVRDDLIDITLLGVPYGAVADDNSGYWIAGAGVPYFSSSHSVQY